MKKTLSSILRCPTCKSPLEEKESGHLYCSGCNFTYAPVDNLLNLLPENIADIKKLECEHYTEKLDYYLQMHSTWCESPFYKHYHGAFLEDLRRLPAGSLILELGCGLGNDGLELLRSGFYLVETDIAPGELAEARKMHEKEGFSANCTHMLSDAEALPFKDGSFDGVFMVAALHHLPNPEAALKEVKRVLKPGGIFVAGTEPNTWQHKTIFPIGKCFLNLAFKLMKKENKTAENVSEADQETEGFSGNELARMFSNAGFSHWELKPAGYFTAAVFFITTEFSNLLGRNIKLFPLERLLLPVDTFLGRISFFSRYPWHWNAVAYS
ncbi:MAG: methyltransferase domain-containing protein [Actinobacteria bacterium]|nr:methyltransferase domain-containing protein [Actinomycetota bacterium]